MYRKNLVRREWKGEELPSPDRLGAKVILVVDDSPQVRRVLCKELVLLGVGSCNEAENGAEALKQAAKVKPDLIILDLAMPVMNGLQAAPLLHRMLPETPIILFTLYDQYVTPAQASNLGISLVCSKGALQTLISNVYKLLLMSPLSTVTDPECIN